MNRMPPQKPPLTLIVATTPVRNPPSPSLSTSTTSSDAPPHTRLGIGHRGTLPWPRIKADMTFFARTTTRAPRAGTTNAVIMGRKTYMSVPGKLRPLKGRMNVVVSRGGDGNGGLREGVLGELKRRKEALQQQQQEKQGSSGDGAGNKDEVEPTDALVAPGLDAALASLEETYGSKGRLGRIFVIGGAEVYASALQMQGRPIRIVMTNVRRKATDAASGDGFECDTFFPVDEFAPESGWRAASAEEVSDWVGERVSGEWRDEGEVLIQMVGYERAG